MKAASMSKIPKQNVPFLKEAMIRSFQVLSAPFGNNRQPYSFVFVRDEAVRKESVSRACHQKGLADAPLIIVSCCNPGDECNCAIALDHLILAATNEGLSPCRVGWIDRENLREILGIP